MTELNNENKIEQRRWLELAVEIGEWNFRNNWETCKQIIEEYDFLNYLIVEEGYDLRNDIMDYVTDKLDKAFDQLRSQSQVGEGYRMSCADLRNQYELRCDEVNNMRESLEELERILDDSIKDNQSILDTNRKLLERVKQLEAKEDE